MQRRGEKERIILLAAIKVLATLGLIVLLLNRKIKIGYAMLAGSLLLFGLAGNPPGDFLAAAERAAFSPNSWEIMLALFFVMCLEHQLRIGGIIDGMMTAARKLFKSDRVLLAIMPSFLGFLPSLGGAIFSAPLVENAGRGYQITPEDKAAINYWFRHVWEFVNPIFTSLLLASQLSGVALADLVGSMAWATAVSGVIGWFYLIAPLKEKDGAASQAAESSRAEDRRFVVLAVAPIIANFIMVVFLKLSAALSMALVVAAMALALRQNTAGLKAMLRHGLDGKVLGGIASILLFQQVLRQTGLITDIASVLNDMAVPAGLVIAVIAFCAGLLTGVSQGFVAITFPFIAELAPGDLTLAMVCFVAGTAGQMLSPAHLCLLVTLDYFKASFFKSLRPILALEIVMLAVTYGVVRFGG